MKKLLKYILLGEGTFNEYKTVSLQDSEIIEQVNFKCGKQVWNVSDNQWLLSLEPMVFGIWLNDSAARHKTESACTLEFRAHHKKIATAHLKRIHCPEEKEDHLFLFEVQQSELFHLSKLRLKWIHRMYYKKEGFEQFKKLVMAFSFPRKVRVISYQEEGYFNLFPMDLVGEIPAEKRFFFGLRHSNITLHKMIKNQRMVASEFPAQKKEQVYQLARHHSVNPPEISELNYGLHPTKQFGFGIPEWVTQYHEISIEKTCDLGSHMLMYGRAVHTKDIREKTQALYHIHFIQYLYHKQNKFRYQEV